MYIYIYIYIYIYVYIYNIYNIHTIYIIYIYLNKCQFQCVILNIWIKNFIEVTNISLLFKSFINNRRWFLRRLFGKMLCIYKDCNWQLPSKVLQSFSIYYFLKH